MAVRTPPRVSVIVPCRNEQGFIRRCLESILASGYPLDRMEVLVADACSTDGTRDEIGAILSRHANVRLIDNPDLSTPAALNRMVRRASGEFIIRFDGHSEMPRNYISTCLDLLETTGAWGVGGMCVPVRRNRSAMARAISVVTSHWFGVGGSRFRSRGGEGPADTVLFGAYPRHVFDTVGLFDERLNRNQDNEFNARIRKNGGQVWLSPRLFVRYYNKGTLASLMKQGFTTGKWNLLTLILAPYAVAFRHVAPGLFVSGIILASALVLLGVAAGLPFLVVCGLMVPVPYVAVWLILSFYMLCVRPPDESVRIPWVFLAYHTSYGAGVLFGAFAVALGRLTARIPGASARPVTPAPSGKTERGAP